MDLALTPAPVGEVRHVIAAACLAGPDLKAELGDIRLVPHQVDAASRLIAMLEQAGGALLADATGMGKTFVAIAVARSISPATVVAPAALRAMWYDALRRARVPARVESYEALSRGTRPAGLPALVILDEAHHARNPASRRYGAIADLCWGSRVLLMTATPIHNRLDDLRALAALFLGSHAWSLEAAELSRFIVRRTAPGRGRTWPSQAVSPAPSLPSIDHPVWLEVHPDPDTLRSIEALPPSVPLAEGGTANALLILGLLRAWSSSAAALRAMLRRRLQRAAAFTASLQSGRYPTRAELASWSVVDGAVQLGFPQLLVSGAVLDNAELLDRAVEEHCAGVRAIIRSLDRSGPDQDAARARLLQEVIVANPDRPVVAFTQFTETAIALYRALSGLGGVALVTGRGARIASGPISTAEVVRRFDDVAGHPELTLPLRVLVATDVLSEGLSLRRAGVLVHLDLPWTFARLEQRIGRLRRLGSPHSRIATFAIGPPVSGRELIRVVRALRRKLHLSAALVSGEFADAEPILGIRLGKFTGVVMGQSDTRATESIRGILTNWLAQRPGDGACAGGRVAVVPASETDGGEGWAALALVRHQSHITLVRVDPMGVTERPFEILPVVKRLDRAMADAVQDCSTSEDATAAPPGCVVDDALQRLRQWIDSRRARELVAPATDSPSAAHTAVLRYLDGLVATAGRADLASLIPRLEQWRRCVTAARGIGAERALDRWLAKRAAAATHEDAIDELVASVSSRLPASVGRSGAGPSVVALLVVHPASGEHAHQ